MDADNTPALGGKASNVPMLGGDKWEGEVCGYCNCHIPRDKEIDCWVLGEDCDQPLFCSEACVQDYIDAEFVRIYE